ncbi:MAG: glucose-6-phosphate dehydrogenase [Thermaerobacter sp.]|nr:glucose-6-phosphate dehydrogenase [Thermaerobacter sp.]
MSPDNPLRGEETTQRRPDPFILVIFGAGGDLTHRKLAPALYSLAVQNLLPEEFAVVGFSRREMSDDNFRRDLAGAVGRFSRLSPVRAQVWQRLAERIFYVAGDFTTSDGYHRLGELLTRLDRERGTGGNRLFYLATPPSFYPTIVAQVGEAGLGRGGGWTRLVVEKPFGKDLTTARELNAQLYQVLQENQIYRIDHYLGKETVQNILALRFANGIFEPVWNRRYVDHVQISVAESLGVERRGSYYEEAGALRDMVQNHLLQLLCLTAMEPPVAFDADAVRDEKVKVLRAIHPFTPKEAGSRAVRGQYTAGWVLGEPVVGYLREPGVAGDSPTETYVALKLFIDNWRWAGVPFYLRTGKRLPKRATEVAIQFKRAPHLLFSQTATPELEPNVLSMRIQPDEGIVLRFAAKVPGPTVRLRTVSMDFFYGTSFGTEPPEAYERLLLDWMLGDSTLFTRRDEVEAAWTLVTSLLESWGEGNAPCPYEAGTWGPREADALLERDERSWRRL